MSDMDKVLEIAKEIHALGGEVFFVGGYVRDKIMGIESKDIDLEIYNISVENVKKILRKYGKVSLIGVSFGILNVSGLDVDFAFPRKERNTGNKHTDFDVLVDPFMSKKEGSFRRDFTMNGIMENVITGEILDYFNGRQDIENKIIRHISKDTFVEDNLRTLRACQFASRFGFTLCDELKALSKTMEYTHLSSERIIKELDKALLSDKPSVALNYLMELGVIKQVFPELYALKGCKQNLEYHPEGDVWNHTMLVIDKGAEHKHKARNPRHFMYACLYHDVGKPDTTKVEDGKIRSNLHDSVGADMIRTTLGKKTTEKDLLKTVYTLTKYHMIAHRMLEMGDVKLRKLMGVVDMSDLLLLHTCDVGGRDLNEHKLKKEEDVLKKYERVEQLSMGGFGKVIPYIQGKDLIEIGYKPSKEMGKILENCFLLQIRGKSKEDIITIYKNKLVKKPTKLDLNLEQFYRLQTINNHEKGLKQRKRYTRFHQICEENKDVRFKNGEGFLKFYLRTDVDRSTNEVSKYLFLPDMVIKTDKRNSQWEVILDCYEQTIEERKNELVILAKRLELTKEQFQFFAQIYGDLRTRK